MSEETVQNSEADNYEINVWEAIGRLMSGWRWLAGGGGAGLLGAIAILTLVPARYEATAVIQPATIGMIATTTTLTTTTAMPVEAVAQTLERLKLSTFYRDGIVKSCQADSAKELLDNLNASVIKGNNLISIRFTALSREAAENCVEQIVLDLTQFQASIAAPLIKELEGQQATTKQQLDELDRFLAQSEKRKSTVPESNESILLMLKREELMQLQRLYREQRIQLSAPLTQSVKLLEPVHAPRKAVFPKKLFTLVSGLAIGLFVGLLALYVSRSRLRYQSTIS